MLRLALLAALLAGPAVAADPAPAGSWKFRLPLSDGSATLLVAFEKTGGQWAGRLVASTARFQTPPAVTAVTVAGPAVKFTVGLKSQTLVEFDGKLSADGKTLSGSYAALGGPRELTEMKPSALTTLDDLVELAREDAAQADGGRDLFNAATAVFANAAAKTIPAGEVKALADKVATAAAVYGPAWEVATAGKVAAALAPHAAYAGLAVDAARRAERLLGPLAPAGELIRVYGVLATAYASAGKPAEAAAAAAQAKRLEAREYAEYKDAGIGYTPPKFAGRKSKSVRAAVVELFTGAECPPCVAVDLAADGLLRAYPPADVILLTYHVPVPNLDPLMTAESVERMAQYGDRVQGTPTVFVNGKDAAVNGGGAGQAAARHADLRAAVDAQLETAAAAAVALTVAPAGAGFTASATVKLADPAKAATLRFALVQAVVRFPGGNGIKFHTRVVRAMPGGAKGFPVTADPRTLTIDPAAVRQGLEAHLAATAKAEGEFPRPEKPLDLADLSLVAFVQDDATGEILQAAEAGLGAK